MEKTGVRGEPGMMQRSPTGSNGFTLMELVIAIAIGSIVTTGVFAGFHTAIKAGEKSESAMMPVREARYVFEMFRQDVLKVPWATKADEIVMGPNACSFPVTVPGMESALVSYALDGRGHLIRQIKDRPCDGENKAIEDTRISTGLNKVVFSKSVKKEEATAVLIKLYLSYNTEPEPIDYRYSVIFEISPNK